MVEAAPETARGRTAAVAPGTARGRRVAAGKACRQGVEKWEVCGRHGEPTRRRPARKQWVGTRQARAVEREQEQGAFAPEIQFHQRAFAGFLAHDERATQAA